MKNYFIEFDSQTLSQAICFLLTTAKIHNQAAMLQNFLTTKQLRCQNVQKLKKKQDFRV